MRLGTSKVLASFIIVAAWPVAAQLPTPHRSDELHGLVVDEAGKPLEGAVVVARWEWLQWIPPRLHGGGYYQNSGEAIHVGESVTDRAGQYRIAAWGPTVKTGGKLDDNQPQVLAFKAGYEPAIGKRDETLRLKKWEGSNAEYAQRILKFQRGTDDYGGARGGPNLAWRQTEDWRDMPRMIEALHRERLRLGEDGAKILGANVLKGRRGEGTVLDASTRKPVEFAILSITWTMRRSDGSPGQRRVVQTKGVMTSGAKFWVSPWRVPGPQLDGWEIATGAIPVVRAYAPGYRHSADIQWTEGGSVVLLEKLPDTREALVTELATWKRDVDAALAQGDRAAMLPLQRPLIASLIQQCNKLTPDVRGGACYGPGSDVATYAMEARNSSVGYLDEDEENVRVVRVVAANAPASRIQAQAVAITPGAMAMSPGSAAIGGRPMVKPRVGGFSIEPAR